MYNSKIIKLIENILKLKLLYKGEYDCVSLMFVCPIKIFNATKILYLKI